MKVNVTDKRRWVEGNDMLVSCLCNGLKIAIRGESWEEAEEKVKKTCKLMKVAGVDNNKDMGEAVRDIPTRLAVEKEKLPEWDNEPYNVNM